MEAELQELLAARVAALREGMTLVRREYPTDIGPVDLLCRDGEGAAVVVEVKRVGEIAGVEQLLRYQERLDRDGRFAPTRGLFVATRVKPQARVFAESRGVEWIEVDLDELRGGVDAPPASSTGSPPTQPTPPTPPTPPSPPTPPNPRPRRPADSAEPRRTMGPEPTPPDDNSPDAGPGTSPSGTGAGTWCARTSTGSSGRGSDTDRR